MVGKPEDQQVYERWGELRGNLLKRRERARLSVLERPLLVHGRDDHAYLKQDARSDEEQLKYVRLEVSCSWVPVQVMTPMAKNMKMKASWTKWIVHAQKNPLVSSRLLPRNHPRKVARMTPIMLLGTP